MESLELCDKDRSEKIIKLKNPNRTTLGREEAKIVELWLSQVNQFTKGYLTLTKSDIVNFLVQQHQPELTIKELQSLRVLHYDPIKHITWITPQIKQALLGSDMSRVLELQEELRKVELSVVKSDSKIKQNLSGSLGFPRRKRKSKSVPVSEEVQQNINLNSEKENSL